MWQAVQGWPVAVYSRPEEGCKNSHGLVVQVLISPCCQDADDVHQEPSLHHVSRPEAAGAVADGVRTSGYRKHEGVTNTDLRYNSHIESSAQNPTYRTGHHEVQRVGAQWEWHLGQDRHLDKASWCHHLSSWCDDLTRMLAQAVLLVISVTNVETKAIRKLTSSGSRLCIIIQLVIVATSLTPSIRRADPPRTERAQTSPSCPPEQSRPRAAGSRPREASSPLRNIQVIKV